MTGLAVICIKIWPRNVLNKSYPTGRRMTDFTGYQHIEYAKNGGDAGIWPKGRDEISYCSRGVEKRVSVLATFS